MTFGLLYVWFVWRAVVVTGIEDQWLVSEVLRSGVRNRERGLRPSTHPWETVTRIATRHTLGRLTACLCAPCSNNKLISIACNRVGRELTRPRTSGTSNHGGANIPT
jgi:hypothetical protein